ncbi:MAG: carbon storage regulator CsrA [Phycisphaerales bacterium]|nr:carbon storage regulator CsrA [bacterium]
MLVLSRQRDETIMIGDDIEITVVDVRGDKVRLGINAPAKIAVHRKEVYEAIRAENERAARVESDDLVELSKSALGRVRDGKPNPKVTNRSSGLVQTQPPNGKAQKRA